MSVSNRMTHSKISFTGDQNCEEDGGAEAHVVEGVGELRDEIHPDNAILGPRPGEHYKIF